MSFSNNYTPSDAVAITPGASELSPMLVGFQCGGAGTVTVTTAAGTSLTITVVAGQQISLQVRKITAATATAITGFLA